MAELSPELAVLLAILTPTAAALLTAWLTHHYAQKREDYAKKMKIVGWLEWLKDFLKQVHDLSPELKAGKLPWWADHSMQGIGDSLHLLPENTRINLLKLIDECWIETPIVRFDYDQSKVQNMINDIEKLIDQIKDP